MFVFGNIVVIKLIIFHLLAIVKTMTSDNCLEQLSIGSWAIVVGDADTFLIKLENEKFDKSIGELVGDFYCKNDCIFQANYQYVQRKYYKTEKVKYILQNKLLQNDVFNAAVYELYNSPPLDIYERLLRRANFSEGYFYDKDNRYLFMWEIDTTLRIYYKGIGIRLCLKSDRFIQYIRFTENNTDYSLQLVNQKTKDLWITDQESLFLTNDYEKYLIDSYELSRNVIPEKFVCDVISEFPYKIIIIGCGSALLLLFVIFAVILSLCLYKRKKSKNLTHENPNWISTVAINHSVHYKHNPTLDEQKTDVPLYEEPKYLRDSNISVTNNHVLYDIPDRKTKYSEQDTEYVKLSKENLSYDYPYSTFKPLTNT